MLAGTIDDTKLARESHGNHRAISERMLKYGTYKDDKHIFEEPAYLALMIKLTATK